MKQENWGKAVTIIIGIWGAWIVYGFLSQMPNGLLAMLVVVVIAGFFILDYFKK